MMELASKLSEFSPIRRWPTEKSKLWVHDYVWRARYDPNILAVVAVGSAVRDAVTSNDLDLVTIVKGNVEKAIERAPVEVDLRAYSSNDLEQKILDGNDYLGWAVKFGQVLDEKDKFWTTLVKKLNNQLPLPSPKVARDRAKAALNHAVTLLKVGDEDAASEQIVSVLTHLGRADLIEAGIYPASRPEIPKQLEAIGKRVEGGLLRAAIEHLSPASALLEKLRCVFPI
jgi:hypothetical protein